MTFLELSPFTVTLLAILTTVVLVATYFLKLRHRRLVIASSLLWSRVLERQEARSLWEKLRRILSVLLVVTIGLLIVLALARPQLKSLSGPGGRMMIVLDTSPSMLARMKDGRTRWQHAIEIAKRLIGSAGAGSEIRIADTSGRYDSPMAKDMELANHLIDGMKPIPGPAHFPESNDAGDTGTQIWFVTDGVASPAVPNGVKSAIVYDAERNAGITAFEVRSTPSTPQIYEAYLEVTNFSKDTRKVTLSLSEGGPGRISRDVQIEGGRSYSELLDLSKFQGGGVRAQVQSDGDAFPLDDVAYSYLPAKKKTKTLLVSKGNPYLQTALKLDPYVDLATATPAEYREDPAIDAYVFDEFAPSIQPAKPALIIGAPAAAWLRNSNSDFEKPSFTSWMEEHPVMQYLSLHDVSISKAARIDPANLTVLASSGSNPLIVASPPGSSGARWLMLTFNLQASDFPVHESFPLFIDNALAWFGRDRPALRRTLGTVEIPIANAAISGIDGKPVTSQSYMDRTVFEAVEPGLFVASRDGQRQYIAVNLMDRRSSDINRRMPVRATEVSPVPGLLRHELSFYIVLTAVLLLGLEWFTYHRRITL